MRGQQLRCYHLQEEGLVWYRHKSLDQESMKIVLIGYLEITSILAKFGM